MIFGILYLDHFVLWCGILSPLSTNGADLPWVKEVLAQLASSGSALKNIVEIEKLILVRKGKTCCHLFFLIANIFCTRNTATIRSRTKCSAVNDSGRLLENWIHFWSQRETDGGPRNGYCRVVSVVGVCYVDQHTDFPWCGL